MAQYWEVLIYGDVPQRMVVMAHSEADAKEKALDEVFERLALCAQKVGEETCRDLSHTA